MWHNRLLKTSLDSDLSAYISKAAQWNHLWLSSFNRQDNMQFLAKFKKFRVWGSDLQFSKTKLRRLWTKSAEHFKTLLKVASDPAYKLLLVCSDANSDKIMVAFKMGTRTSILKENYLCKFSFHFQNTRGSRKNTSCLFCQCCVSHPCFVLLSIVTIPSDKQSKKWQKRFIYILSHFNKLYSFLWTPVIYQ